ncbi:CsbD family protein [Synechococcus sp. 1G10]|uniref:CsbD family protein n=1 Tax=Synechococcus sp. 1G10 TaxID=2025605 RepID=UPI001E522346|nr:CsbD family protein [Synechococcus sp. 1G10]
MKLFPFKLITSLWALVIAFGITVFPAPAQALVHIHAPFPIAFAAMSNKFDAAAKDAEGKLESAYGELTGDTGHQIKGKAKQVQASAVNTAEDLKQGAKAAAKKVSEISGQAADNIK